eukprot:scaffold874_cov196-Alexandrium_tamarense.AAC.14
MKSYDASIKEATDLKFVHEEGLACEKGLQTLTRQLTYCHRFVMSKVKAPSVYSEPYSARSQHTTRYLAVSRSYFCLSIRTRNPVLVVTASKSDPVRESTD